MVMKDQITLEIVKYLVPTILSFLIGFFINQFLAFRGFLQIIKWVSRRAIIDDAKFYLEQGYITPKQKAEYKKLWNVYHKRLKGNSEGEAYYDLVQKLPVKVDKDESK